MNKENGSVTLVAGLAVLLSLSAIIAVAAHWPNRGNTSTATPAAASAVAPVKTVRIVMHDPGCHWFQTTAGLKRSLQVSGSAVKLTNLDEAALKIVGPGATTVEKVGANVQLGRGAYRITMVGQKPDDNTLSLVVS
jgi:hypothetical protein